MASIFGLTEVREYTGCRLVEDAAPELINDLYRKNRVAAGLNGLGHTANQCFIFRNGSSSALARFSEFGNEFRRIQTSSAFHISPRNAEQIMALDLLLDPDIPLVSLTGKAGTGKTLLALAAALEQRRQHRQILLARPTIPLRDIGFLPGNINEKIDPYMMPLYDNLRVIAEKSGDRVRVSQMLGKMREDQKMVIEPLAFIRGRSLNCCFMIVDEAQNLDAHEIKTIVSRAGEGTKIVFTGDTDQIDNPKLSKDFNGLSHIINRLKGEVLYAHIHLVKGERSPLADLAARKL